ncbi:hypothetical protein Q5741_20680 [Paenibacillus sp. JX-17]|uniref:Lipoprotein n=2 Tax=Paenibacillus lacisoli TaxID=3064525 RepID=A0ABT9CHQ4_9BACL|nr:hypothetical protein [Paenibacillus sp. JX-17]MDO7908804.1 hypothetical protein [Paenibacillus sp. JX-17]
MTKRSILFVSLLTLSMSLSLAACGPKPQSSPSVPAKEETSQNQPETSEPAAQPEIQSAQGVYNGAADPHTVEIELNGQATAFQLGEGLENTVNDFEEGDKVNIEYLEKAVEGDSTVKQLILTKIEKTDGASDSAGNSGGTSSGQGSNTAGTERPATQEFEVTLEGSTEKQPAQLAEGNGYSLYVFDPMSFFPDQNRVAMAVDDHYYAEIKKLPSDFSLDTLEQEGREDLKAAGTVSKVEKSSYPSGLTDAHLVLQAANDKTTEQYIVIENASGGFAVKVSIPQGEPAEGFSNYIYTTLQTLQAASK